MTREGTQSVLGIQVDWWGPPTRAPEWYWRGQASKGVFCAFLTGI